MSAAEHDTRLARGGGEGTEVDRSHHKSYKRKYRKLKSKFDLVMKQSDDLFKKDIIATAQVKRISEENVRLLDLLLDLNSSSHIPKSRYYNIGSPSSETPVGFLSPAQLAAYRDIDGEDVEPMDLDGGDTNGTGAGGRTVEIREKQQKRRMRSNSDTEDSEEREEREEREDRDTEDEDQPRTPLRKPNGATKVKQEVDENDLTTTTGAAEPTTPPPFKRPRILLEDTEYHPGSTPPYLRDPSPFLLPVEDEEEYYHTIDAHFETHGKLLASPTSHPDNNPTTPISKSHSSTALTSSTDKSATTATTATTTTTTTTTTGTTTAVGGEEQHSGPRNPMSVFCWLKKYQPQIFLQDPSATGPDDAHGSTITTTTGTGKKPRKSGPRVGSKKNHHPMNDDSGAVFAFANQNDDQTGGSSSRKGEIPPQQPATPSTTVPSKRKRKEKDANINGDHDQHHSIVSTPKQRSSGTGGTGGKGSGGGRREKYERGERGNGVEGGGGGRDREREPPSKKPRRSAAVQERGQRGSSP